MNKQDVIKNIFPDVISIDYAIDSKTSPNVFFVTTTNKKYVAKFSSKDLALRNLRLSKVLQDYKIAVPNTEIHNYKDTYIEVYPFIDGITLDEAYTKKISSTNIQNVYKSVCENIIKTQQIPIEHVCNFPLIHPDQLRFVKQTSTYSETIRKLCAVLKIYILNRFPQPKFNRLSYYDFSDKNILLDENYNFKSFLDLDSFAVGNLNYAISVILLYADKHNISQDELLNIFSKAYIPVNQTAIKKMVCFTQFCKTIRKEQ